MADDSASSKGVSRGGQGAVGNTQTNYNSGGANTTTGARGATGPGGEKSVTGSKGATTSGYGSNTTSKNPGSTAGSQKSSTGDRGPLGPGGQKSVTGSGSGGAGPSGYGGNTTSKNNAAGKNNGTGPRGPTGPGGEPKSPSQVSPGSGIKGTGPRGPLGPGGQASNPNQVKPPSQTVAPGKGSLPNGVRVPTQPTVTTSTLPTTDPRRRQTAFANPTTPIQGNVLRQQVGTPTQQALAEEARKRRNVGPDNTIGNIVAGDNYMRTPVGPTPPGQQVSDLTGVGAIDGVRPGFPSLQPSQPKIAGRVPTGPQVASYDPLGSVQAPSAPSIPSDLAAAPSNPSRGITRPGQPPVAAPGKSDLAAAPPTPRDDRMPPSAVRDTGYRTPPAPTTPEGRAALRTAITASRNPALAKSLAGDIPPGETLGGPRPGFEAGPDPYANYNTPGPSGLRPGERVVAVEPYQNDPALRSMPPNPTGRRGLPGLQPSDLATPTDVAEYEGAAPNPGNNVDKRMANYSPNPPTNPADDVGAGNYITGGAPLDSDPDVMGADDEIGGFDTGNTFNANTPEQYGDTPGGEIGGGPTMGDGGDSPILYDTDGNPLPNQGGGGGGGGTDGGTDGGGTPPAPPVPGVENLMPWDVSTYMELRNIYAQSGIDYTPEQFMDEYYDTRALANPSVDLPDRPSPASSALAAQYATQDPTVGINPADELIAA